MSQQHHVTHRSIFSANAPMIVALLLGAFIWMGAPGADGLQSSWACSPPVNQYNQVGSDYGSISQPMCMSSAAFGSIISLILYAPYTTLSLIPLIGNSVVLAGKYSAGVRRGWGITGIVMGSIGTIAGIGLTTLYFSEGPFGNSFGLWAATLLPQMVVYLTNIILGAFNVHLANVSWLPKDTSVSPYFRPMPNGQFSAGANLSFRF